MTTIYNPDPCIPPHPIAETVRERLLSVLLRKTLPILWREELSTRTNADLRQLINEIESITQDKPMFYKPDDYSLVERDTL